MKGDFSSRTTIDEGKHYSGVLHQQGRVWLDSDWNEDVLERLHLLQQETADLIGCCGVPEPGTAFRISRNPDPNAPEDDFRIEGGPGRLGHCYVGGILCQNDATTSYLTQPDLPNAPRIDLSGETVTALVYLEVWQRLITFLEDEEVREVALGGPDTATRLKTVAQVKVLVLGRGSSFVTSPPDEFQLEPSCATAATHLPKASLGTLTTLQPTDTQPGDPCKLPDPGNFTGRENHLYRIEIHEGGNVAGEAGASFPVKLKGDHAAGARLLKLSDDLPQIWIDALQRAGGASLNADNGQTERISVSAISNPRTVALDRPLRLAFPASKHPTLTVGIATFKWSRENACFAARVTNIDSSRQILTLSSIARDQATALREGDFVEICDDATELGPGRGFLTQLTADPDPDLFTAPIADPLPPNFRAGAGDRHIILRRWDGVGLAGNHFDLATTPDLDLGDGVHIQFGGSGLRTGDYWQFTARVIDGSVQALVNQPPHGIVRRFSPLAVVRWTLEASSPPSSPPDYAFSVVHDCRCVFPPLCQPGIHITDVVGINDRFESATLLNDKTVQVTGILGGIDIICDGLVAPSAISRAVCFVTLDVPFRGLPGQRVGAHQRIVVAADVSASFNRIHWQPRMKEFLTQLPYHLAMANTAHGAGDPGILARLVLNGNYIWDPETSRYLDGDTFGVARSATDPSTDWRHPSGNGARGGTFEMWFWLTPPDQPQPFTVKVEAKPHHVRQEGFNELVADIVLKASGGTPTDPVPTYNIVVDAAPYEIASPQLNPGGRLDVVLLIDDPAGFGFSGSYPRLFLGERISPTSTTSVLFRDVPLQATEFGETRAVRIKNLRLNLAAVFVPSAPASIPIANIALLNAQASARSTSTPGLNVGLTPGFAPAFISAGQLNLAPNLTFNPLPEPISVLVSITGSQPVVVEGNPRVVVALALRGVSVTPAPNTGQTLPVVVNGSAGINPVLLFNPGPVDVPANFYIQFTEGFPDAFRSRINAIASPPGQLLQEVGFEGPHPVYFIGNAVSGTRLHADLGNIPEGVQIFVTTQDVKPGATSPAPAQARLVPTDVFEGGAGSVPNATRFVPDPGGPTSNGIPLLAVPVADGSGIVEWEWVAQEPVTTSAPATRRSVLFGVVAAALPGLKVPGEIVVSAGLAPGNQPTVPSFTVGAFEPLGTVISVKVTGGVSVVINGASSTTPITTPTNQVVLDACATTTTTGGTLTFAWAVAAGSPSASISDGSTCKATIQLGAGKNVYKFTLTVTDSKGAAPTVITVTVNFI